MKITRIVLVLLAIGIQQYCLAQEKLKVVIAGLNPPKFLVELIEKYPHIRLRTSPNEEEMTQLVRNAHIHVLYTAQPTGLKLKLLNVLFKGKFVICNTHMIAVTGLHGNRTMILADTPTEFVANINDHFHKEFTEAHIREREQLIVNFDNERNTKKLIDAVFN